jgi:hypothetical protein
MTRMPRWPTWGLALALAACSDIAPPVRNDLYEWRLIVPNATSTAVDSLSFHWPHDRLPVRIWAEDAAGLPGYVAGGIAAWRPAFLYDEFDATLVGDSTAADVIVRASSPPGPALSRVRLHAVAPECDGATDLDISDDHTQLRLPVRVYVNPGFTPDAAALDRCMALTTTHELGHALGIFRHSPETTDLMYSDPTVEAPTERDLGTAEILYHVKPNLVPVNGER